MAALLTTLPALPAWAACSRATYHDASEAVATGVMAAELDAHHADMVASNQWNSAHHYNGDKEIAESHGWVWDDTSCSFSSAPAPTTTLAPSTTVSPPTTAPSTTTPTSTTPSAPSTTIPLSTTVTSTRPTSASTVVGGTEADPTTTSTESTQAAVAGPDPSSSTPTIDVTGAEVAGIEIEAVDAESPEGGSWSWWPLWLGLGLVLASTMAWPIARRRQG